MFPLIYFSAHGEIAVEIMELFFFIDLTSDWRMFRRVFDFFLVWHRCLSAHKKETVFGWTISVKFSDWESVPKLGWNVVWTAADCSCAVFLTHVCLAAPSVVRLKSSNDWTNNELERTWNEPVSTLFKILCWPLSGKDWVKPRKSCEVIGFWADIWTRALPHTKRMWWPHDHVILCERSNDKWMVHLLLALNPSATHMLQLLLHSLTEFCSQTVFMDLVLLSE